MKVYGLRFSLKFRKVFKLNKMKFGGLPKSRCVYDLDPVKRLKNVLYSDLEIRIRETVPNI